MTLREILGERYSQACGNTCTMYAVTSRLRSKNPETGLSRTRDKKFYPHHYRLAGQSAGLAMPTHGAAWSRSLDAIDPPPLCKTDRSAIMTARRLEFGPCKLAVDIGLCDAAQTSYRCRGLQQPPWRAGTQLPYSGNALATSNPSPHRFCNVCS